jgi:hypothetical protein
MNRRQIWLTARALLLGLAIVGASMALLPGGTSVVEAGVAQQKKEDKDDTKNKNNDKKEIDQQYDQDHILQGQVLEINTLKDPPEMIVGTVDGRCLVKVLKTDEIALNGVGIGDYVELDGEKISEVLFEATGISVSAKGGNNPESSDNDDN